MVNVVFAILHPKLNGMNYEQYCKTLENLIIGKLICALKIWTKNDNKTFAAYLFCYRINQPDEYILLLSST